MLNMRSVFSDVVSNYSVSGSSGVTETDHTFSTGGFDESTSGVYLLRRFQHGTTHGWTLGYPRAVTNPRELVKKSIIASGHNRPVQLHYVRPSR